jgi:hypothetical protein
MPAEEVVLAAPARTLISTFPGHQCTQLGPAAGHGGARSDVPTRYGIARQGTLSSRHGSETRAAIAALGETMNAGFARMARMEARMDAGFARMDAGFARMDAGFARMDAGFASMDAGFARMDRYFQVQHQWMQSWIDELRHERELRCRTDALSDRVKQVEQKVDPTREYITHEIAEIRLELFELRYEAWQIDYLSPRLAALTERVDRLDPRRHV